MDKETVENVDAENKSRDPVEAQKDPAFYTDAAAYWEKVPPTVNGVLGGFEKISSTDITGSDSFLRGVFRMKNPPSRERVVDCGAGIGRITKNLLVRYFNTVDLVEQCRQFIEKSRETLRSSNKIGNYYCLGLQDFTPSSNCYDIVWIQWVLGHLNDEDLEAFFKRLIPGLKPNGVIVVKENLSGSGEVELDVEDSSVTRPQSLLLKIFDRAGLKVIRNVLQRNFPKGLYEVRMFCLRPKT